MGLLTKKSIDQINLDMEDPDRSLKRELTAWDIAVMGVAVAVGAGIFSVGAQAAADYAGPSVIISFLIAALVCGLAVMNYAEFASAIPVSGSAYTFSYVAMGELIAWIIGWDLILEMLMAASVISKYWGIYLQSVFDFLHIDVPTLVHIGTVEVSWPPVVIVAVFTILLVLGTKLTSRVNSIFTIIKVGITIFVVIAGAAYIKIDNYKPFFPPSEPGSSDATGVLRQSLFAFAIGGDPTKYGMYGLLSASAIVFFAFVGFDIVATTAEETKDPQKNLPKGIFGGLALVSLLYVAVTIVVTGMVSYKELAAAGDPSLATAFQLVGANWVGTVITIGILVGLTTVIMVLLLGLARVVFAMSRDGLLPRGISQTSKRGTPARLQVLCGIVVATIAALVDVDELAEMINIGTLSAFVLVSFSIPIMRKRQPDLKRGFTVPGNPWLPILSGVLCLWLMANLAVETWLRFVVWLLVGLAIYFGYSYMHSQARVLEAHDGKESLGWHGRREHSITGSPRTAAWTYVAAILTGMGIIGTLWSLYMIIGTDMGIGGMGIRRVWATILIALPAVVVGAIALRRSELGEQKMGVVEGTFVTTRWSVGILAAAFGTMAVGVLIGIIHAVVVL